MTIAVETRDLRKKFGATMALNGVDLEVPRATVLGLLGPNGAGKTTTVRILTTLLQPDGGSARIDGIDVVDDPRAVRARIGLTGQYAAVDERLTGTENLEHIGRLFRLSAPHARQRAAELLPVEDRSTLVAARTMGKIYFRLLEEIERADYDVFHHQVRLHRPERFLIALNEWAHGQEVSR